MTTELAARQAELTNARLRREILAGLGTISTQAYQTKKLMMVLESVNMAVEYKTTRSPSRPDTI
ncbi:MAG: hypothetical protein DCF32_09565 [Leptolyngbya sp.]|nr:MAG: hypothetical protein DCF32_09565 [Leptolyngbya sp.]